VVYKVVSKEYPDYIICYFKGLQMSKNGTDWYDQTLEDLMILSELEKNNQFAFVPAPEIEDDRTPVAKYLNRTDLLSLENACKTIGFNYYNTDKGGMLNCKREDEKAHKLTVIYDGDATVIVYCPTCNCGLVNMLALLFVVDDLSTELLTVDISDDVVWRCIDENELNELLTLLENNKIGISLNKGDE